MVTRLGAIALVVALSTGLLAFPAAGAPPQRPPIEVTAAFGKDTYRPGESARLVAILTNVGLDEITVSGRCEPSPNGPHGPLASELVIPAGAARTVVITEQVPETAARFGYLSAESCAITAPRYPHGVKVTARAKVPGQTGDARGRIFQDHDGDNEIDDGEALAGTAVEVTNPDTGAVIARPVTDERGGFAVEGVPAMVYTVRVPGPWAVQHKAPGWFGLPVVAGEPAEHAFAVTPGPKEENNRPNLAVSAAFDQPAYTSGDEVRATVTITNVGEVTAVGVRGEIGPTGPTTVHHDGDPFDDFNKHGAGAAIAPGASRTMEVVGSVWDPSGGGVLLRGTFTPANGDMSFANNEFRIVAPVTTTRGSFSGTVYGDRNHNNQLDAGEELGRASIQLYGDGARGEYRQSADSGGRFAFNDLPAGRYLAIYRIPGGWVLPSQYVMVDGTEQANVSVRALRPISEALTASIAFAKDTYAPEETAALTVKLTNTGSRSLVGVTATCADDLGLSNEISSADPGWGALGEKGAGVTVEVGETRTFPVTSRVPKSAFTAGYVLANCRFGIGPLTNPDSRATARAVAKVPGGIGTAEGLLVFDKNADGKYDGDGIANTAITLVDPMTGKATGTAVTDNDGHFLFKDMPANRYELLINGQWKNPDYRTVDMNDGQTAWLVVFVVPGPRPPDPNAPPQPPAPQQPPAQARRLASTGANVIGMSIWGIAALLAGVGLLFVRRRDAQQP